jgi:hypothetical protein
MHLGRHPPDTQVLSRASEVAWTAKDAIDWQGDQFWQGITARATGLLSSKRVDKKSSALHQREITCMEGSMPTTAIATRHRTNRKKAAA